MPILRSLLPALAFVGLALVARPSTAQKAATGGLQVQMTAASSGLTLRGSATLVSQRKRLAMNGSGLAAWSALIPGPYKVRCEKAGHLAVTQTAVVRAGAVTVVQCRMSALAKLRIKKKDKGGYAAEAVTSGSGKASQHRPMTRMRRPSPIMVAPEIIHNTENYDHISENPYHSPTQSPLSTFSIDVDTASYSNVRRFLNSNTMPPADAVKLEELINYFSYSDAPPRNETPFSVHTEVSQAPWNDAHHLVRIGIKGREVDTHKLPASNLVFLLDVSGSMNSADKLPLLKAAFRLLVDNLRPNDRVAVVVYAGAAGVVLPSTSGAEKSKILAAIEKLSAGGSTAGGAGIELAYQIAKKHFIKGGNNRVILATDGDFNVGTSSEGELTRLIEDKRKSGVFLTVLGFGTGNYQDAKMEQLADKGNGNHAYIDSILEAKKVLVTEMGGTLLTIAKDVKLQVEFNPSEVKAYRLIGYENRKLEARDFNDDKKDAGELGAGNSITALYEIIPAKSKEKIAGIDELKYQRLAKTTASSSSELMTVKLRYKSPRGSKSKLLSQVVNNKVAPLAKASDNLRFAAAVAEFGMLLRDSKLKGKSSYAHVLSSAKRALGTDVEGYRSEFLTLVDKARLLKR